MGSIKKSLMNIKGDSMLKHIVMWKLKDDNREAHARQMKQMLEAMQGKVSGLHRIEVGINAVPGADTCDLVLYSEFEDAQALAAYNDHPDHLAIKDFVKQVRLTRHQVDYFD
jgi:quinol monooxygenase YgiN